MKHKIVIANQNEEALSGDEEHVMSREVRTEGFQTYKIACSPD